MVMRLLTNLKSIVYFVSFPFTRTHELKNSRTYKLKNSKTYKLKNSPSCNIPLTPRQSNR